jgi:hypothetical protein
VIRRLFGFKLGKLTHLVEYGVDDGRRENLISRELTKENNCKVVENLG